MRRTRRTAVLGTVLALAAIAGAPLPAAAASVSFSTSYAIEDGSFGGGSVTYKAGSGVYNYLRATAAADVLGWTYQLVSLRVGAIGSSSVRYTGPTGGWATVRVSGNFSRELHGGFSLVNGAGFQHQLLLVLWDTTAGKAARQWTLHNEEILCGGLVYPVGVGGCNGASSDTYPSAYTRTASGSALVNGHYYRIRVYAISAINAGGFVLGLQGRTTARDLSGSISW